jgi:hypothetical protein
MAPGFWSSVVDRATGSQLHGLAEVFGWLWLARAGNKVNADIGAGSPKSDGDRLANS